MQSLEDLQKQLARLQIANQQYGFLLNAMQYVKIRQQATANDMKYSIMETKIINTLDSLISENTAFSETPKPVTPVKPLEVL